MVPQNNFCAPKIINLRQYGTYCGRPRKTEPSQEKYQTSNQRKRGIYAVPDFELPLQRHIPYLYLSNGLKVKIQDQDSDRAQAQAQAQAQSVSFMRLIQGRTKQPN